MKNYKTKFIFTICVLAIAFNIFFFKTPAYSEVTRQKKILILNSYDKGNDLNGFTPNNWHDEITDGIESSLMDSRENVDLKIEYMDSKFNVSDEYYEMLYNLYKYKFNDANFDTIIALNNNATDFLAKYSKDLFPNTPILFSGVDQSKKSTLSNEPNFTGIYKNEDFKSTFDIALKFHPNTKHFFIILDKTSQGLTYKNMLEQLGYIYEKRVDFTFCNDSDINAVKEKISNLPDHTVIFIAAQYNDNKGSYIPKSEVSNILFKYCPLPVYSPSYAYLNNGIVGGVITDGKKLGVSLGTIASRILNGEKPSDIPSIIDDSHNYVFDFNQLKRFKIDMLSLPKDSEVINIPSSTYSISKKVIIFISAGFISLLILIIAFLLVIIRKLKNTKKLLSDNESLLKTIMNSTPDIICFKDPNERILQANNSILDLLNIKEKDYKFKSFGELINVSCITKNNLATFKNYDNKCWEYGDVYRTEEIVTHQRENIDKTYDIIRIPLFNEDNTKRGLILIGRDITEHKANEKNKKIIAELRYYDKLKMNFFTNLSHELRTPLNVIFSALQVIDETLKNNNTIHNINSGKINKYTHIMKQNCYRLIRLMNNFIDINKIDYGNFSLELQNIDIINVVESIVLSVADYVEGKGISIIFDTEVEEKVISCDPNMLERIILNLLSNAVKFTPAGGNIIINIYCKNDEILISVKDTGIGIPPKKQEAIFKRFVQVDKSLSRNREGSGIGLSLVKSLIELLNGTINVISKPNEGTEFIIKLPDRALTDTKASVSDYNLNKNKAEIIRIEFSDIYG
jgi:signal transduction histidine kinase/ABC-type uncharacterized transport system substrate-binding protein